MKMYNIFSETFDIFCETALDMRMYKNKMICAHPV